MALARRAAITLKALPWLYGPARTLWQKANERLPPLEVDGIDGPVHRAAATHGIRRIRYEPAGWMSHQDVHVFVAQDA